MPRDPLARIQVTDYRSTVRALNAMDKNAKKVVLSTLAATAEPVAVAARQKIQRWTGARANTIRPVALASGVAVRQTARKVSGARGDFGRIQMQQVLIPSLDEHEREIEHAVDRALELLARAEGF